MCIACNNARVLVRPCDVYLWSVPHIACTYRHTYSNVHSSYEHTYACHAKVHVYTHTHTHTHTQVATCLAAVTGHDETPEGGYNTRVKATYVRLDKGKFVCLQPRTRDFARAMSSVRGSAVPVFDSERGKWVLPGLEGVLHQALQPLCALTLGDTVRVEHAGGVFELDVVQLEPAQQVSLIDTDIQVCLAVVVVVVVDVVCSRITLALLWPCVWTRCECTDQEILGTCGERRHLYNDWQGHAETMCLITGSCLRACVRACVCLTHISEHKLEQDSRWRTRAFMHAYVCKHM